LARRLVKGQNALLFAGLEDAIGNKDFAVGDNRAGVPDADPGPPAGGKTRGREVIDDAFLAPRAVAQRPAPLGPVVAVARSGKGDQ
jgi:hypothetical protein